LLGSDRNRLVRAGFTVGEAIEDNARIANFLDGIQNGLSPDEAALRVKKYLFNYDALSDFERKVLRRWVPFYTWTRYNLPLQLEMFITRPAQFATIPKGINLVEKGMAPQPPSGEMIPDWMNDALPVRAFQTGPDKFSYFLLGGWLPSAQLFQATDPVSFLSGMITPVVKAPAEWITNYSMFFKDRIERYPGETSEFLGRRLGKKQINLLRNLRLVNNIDKVIFDEDTTGREKIVSQLFGRMYPVNYAQERFFRAYDLARERSAMVIAIKKEQSKLDKDLAAGKGDRNKKHVEALQKRLAELDAEIAVVGSPLPRRRKRIKVAGGLPDLPDLKEAREPRLPELPTL